MPEIENLVWNDFLNNMGADWVAVAANGHPIARATTEAAVRRAAPDAAHYIDVAALHRHIDRLHNTQGESVVFTGTAFNEPELSGTAPASIDIVQAGTAETDADPRNPNVQATQGSAFDHDNSGAAGGSEKGDASTAHKGAVKKAAAVETASRQARPTAAKAKPMVAAKTKK